MASDVSQLIEHACWQSCELLLFTVDQSQLQVLLVRQNKWPYQGRWALPGGLVRAGESSLDTALRVLGNTAGVQHKDLEQLFTFDQVGRDPRGPIIATSYFGLLPKDKVSADLWKEEYCWFSIGTDEKSFRFKAGPLYCAPEDLAFDHYQMIERGIFSLRRKYKYNALAFELLPRKFTIRQLKELHEAILGKKLYTPSFRKYINQWIHPLDEWEPRLPGQRHRIGRLYVQRI